MPVAAVGATLLNAWLDSVRPPAAIDVPGEADGRAPARYDEEGPVATRADEVTLATRADEEG